MRTLPFCEILQRETELFELCQMYFIEIDKILFHDNRRQGFSILDPATNSVVKETAQCAG